jgi:hypothetical protein
MKVAADAVADWVTDRLLPWLSFTIFSVVEILFIYALYRIFIPR